MNFQSRRCPKNDDTSSSSDDEISVDAFREACDDNFLPQSLFTNDSSITKLPEFETKAKGEMKPSLRVREGSDNFESFGVSPSFKDYVAKKLDALLDRSIIDQDGNNSTEEVPKKKRKSKKKNRLKKEAGIKLLSSSDEIITKVEEFDVEKERRIIKPWKFTRESESTNMIKCQEVAVDSEWILSKTETKVWSERSKGAVFKYKRGGNGALIQQQ